MVNNLEIAKDKMQEWLTSNGKYDILTKRVIENPNSHEMMTFNIVFSDNERSVRYTLTGFQNKSEDCCLIFEAVMFTGLDEDIEEKHLVKGYEIETKNMGKGKEALIKLTRWYKGEIQFDPQDLIDVSVEYGINKLVY